MKKDFIEFRRPQQFMSHHSIYHNHNSILFRNNLHWDTFYGTYNQSLKYTLHCRKDTFHYNMSPYTLGHHIEDNIGNRAQDHSQDCTSDIFPYNTSHHFYIFHYHTEDNTNNQDLGSLLVGNLNNYHCNNFHFLYRFFHCRKVYTRIYR